MRRGRTLIHVAIERLESIKFRQMVKLNPFILCHPRARIETVVEEVTSAELVQLTQRKKEEERVRATLALEQQRQESELKRHQKLEQEKQKLALQEQKKKTAQLEKESDTEMITNNAG